MTTVEVFDPAMCCSTGVCGPSVDPALPKFAADLEWLGRQGVPVSRFNLAQQPDAFAARPAVREALQRDGDSALPLVLVDGEPVSHGRYPERSELAGWAGVAAPAALTYTAQIEELVAIGAAIASNCSPCLEYHVGKAHDLGLDDAVIRAAIQTARVVKAAPARAVLRRADELLAPANPSTKPAAPAAGAPTSGSTGAPDECVEAEDDAPQAPGACCGDPAPAPAAAPVPITLTPRPAADAPATGCEAGQSSSGCC
jgi:AhpD family alkylhydroperoxidase